MPGELIDQVPTWVVILVAAGAVCSALLAIVALAIRTGRGMKTLGTWLADIVRREMRQEVAPLIERRTLSAAEVVEIVREHGLSHDQVTEIVEAKVAPIHAEVRPNGGESLKDQMTRTEQQVSQTARLLSEHMKASALDRSDLRRWLEHVDPGRNTDPSP